MRLLFIGIIIMLVISNIGCFVKSKKYLKKVTGNDEESNNNYKQGMKYIKISVVISFLICLTGATFVIITKFFA